MAMSTATMTVFAISTKPPLFFCVVVIDLRPSDVGGSVRKGMWNRRAMEPVPFWAVKWSGVRAPGAIAAAASRRPVWSSSAVVRHGGDDDDCLRLGVVVGQAEIDLRAHAGRGDRRQPLRGIAGQYQGRLARRQVDHPEVAPEHAGAKAGAERLGAGFLGGEALGIAGGAAGPRLRLAPLGLGEQALGEAAAETLQRLLDAADVDDVAADAEDHPRGSWSVAVSGPRRRWRPSLRVI